MYKIPSLWEESYCSLLACVDDCVWSKQSLEVSPSSSFSCSLAISGMIAFHLLLTTSSDGSSVLLGNLSQDSSYLYS